MLKTFVEDETIHLRFGETLRRGLKHPRVQLMKHFHIDPQASPPNVGEPVFSCEGRETASWCAKSAIGRGSLLF